MFDLAHSTTFKRKSTTGAKSDQVCQYTSGPAIDVAKAVFESCEPDHILAIESQAEVEPMWLVRVIRKRGCVGPAKKFADGLGAPLNAFGNPGEASLV